MTSYLTWRHWSQWRHLISIAHIEREWHSVPFHLVHIWCKDSWHFLWVSWVLGWTRHSYEGLFWTSSQQLLHRVPNDRTKDESKRTDWFRVWILPPQEDRSYSLTTNHISKEEHTFCRSWCISLSVAFSLSLSSVIFNSRLVFCLWNRSNSLSIYRNKKDYEDVRKYSARN